ncbi:hypothetical protein Y032_0227g2829 [Ancylostoma ceylanicum]|uniref:PKD domain-containing protein n=1 Tax=Ancylostoma ceylanicum TaxID=53326 RepID=A0A016SHS2_9BILA|nr:hypothetical protein Y032_0227g2829 [Ancylostoma ceylanicum]
MVLGTSSFFYFFQMLNNWPKVFMFIWESSHSPFVATVPIEVHPLSSTLDLHNNRLINSLTDFEQFYGVVTVTACNFSASANVTYRWQLFHEGSRMHAFQTNTCHTTVHCIKDGSYTIQLSVIGRHGELLRVGSRTFESRPLWMAIIGDSFASGEGNPDIQRKGYANAQWINERCHRSGKSFAAQVFAEIQKVKPQSYLTYLACAGATVENGILKAKGRISQLEALESVATMRFQLGNFFYIKCVPQDKSSRQSFGDPSDEIETPRRVSRSPSHEEPLTGEEPVSRATRSHSRSSGSSTTQSERQMRERKQPVLYSPAAKSSPTPQPRIVKRKS